MRRWFRTWFLGVTIVTALLVLVIATYAWFSSNKKVATVTKGGVILAKKSGKTNITVKAGKKKKVIWVTVKK